MSKEDSALREKLAKSNSRVTISTLNSFIYFFRLLDFLIHLREKEEDQTIFMKFIKAMPENIMNILRQEISKNTKKGNSKVEKIDKSIQEIIDLTRSFVNNPRDMSDEPEFFKKYVRNMTLGKENE